MQTVVRQARGSPPRWELCPQITVFPEMWAMGPARTSQKSIDSV